MGGKGTECYYYHSSINGKIFATKIYEAIAPLTISADRGVKPDTALYASGLYECRETSAVACLIEIMFHDNLTDVNDYLSKVDVMALSMAKAIYSYLGIAYVETSKPTPVVIATTERERGIQMIFQVSKWAEDYIREFDAIQAKGINVWGLIPPKPQNPIYIYN